jgi:hypothetical protein
MSEDIKLKQIADEMKQVFEKMQQDYKNIRQKYGEEIVKKAFERYYVYIMGGYSLGYNGGYND